MNSKKKISSLEAWERQVANLANRKQKKAKKGQRGIKIRPNEIVWLPDTSNDTPEQMDFWIERSPWETSSNVGSRVMTQRKHQKPANLGAAQSLPGQCLGDTNTTKRKRTQPRRLSGGCLLYRFPPQLRRM